MKSIHDVSMNVNGTTAEQDRRALSVRFRIATRETDRARDLLRQACQTGSAPLIDDAAVYLVKCVTAEESIAHALLAANAPDNRPAEAIAQAIIDGAYSASAADGSICHVAINGNHWPGEWKTRGTEAQ